jgi:hypothetical protein
MERRLRIALDGLLEHAAASHTSCSDTKPSTPTYIPTKDKSGNSICLSDAIEQHKLNYTAGNIQEGETRQCQ